MSCPYASTYQFGCGASGLMYGGKKAKKKAAPKRKTVRKTKATKTKKAAPKRKVARRSAKRSLKAKSGVARRR